MRRFDPYPQCMECLCSLAREAATKAFRERNPLGDRLLSRAPHLLEKGLKAGLSSPQAANWLMDQMRRLSGVSDPYARFKAREMEQARRLAQALSPQMDGSLKRLVTFAALGNSFDFFLEPSQALARLRAELERGIPFHRDETEHLERVLSQGPRTLLYLTDNAGEIYFDLPLYRYLSRRVPRVVLVVKGGPSLNDLTRAELRHDGLEQNFKEVADTGADGAGLDWPRLSPAFLDLVREADLIVSKGMANFETLALSPVSIPRFLIFKAKCPPIQHLLGCKGGDYLALWEEGEDVSPAP